MTSRILNFLMRRNVQQEQKALDAVIASNKSELQQLLQVSKSASRVMTTAAGAMKLLADGIHNE